MGIIAVTTMILAAVMAERRELEQRKQERILALDLELISLAVNANFKLVVSTTIILVSHG